MVRSMYSGVSGMRAHQSRMDVIGNNIANVNTYGFKGSRATFRDIYYQTVKGASAGSASRGGVNPSSIGVGTKLASVDVLQTRSTFTQTDKETDVAIDGEGFLQVQDADGNKFYTRAGMLDFDSAGNLIDAQGNFVLGTNGNPIGQAAGSSLIQVNLPAVTAAASSGEQTINGIKYTISTSEFTKEGNLGLQFVPGNDMNDDIDCTAKVTEGGIVVYVNPNKTFATISDFSTAVNAAIQKASTEETGKGHPAGDFKIDCDKPDEFQNMKGSDIVSSDYAPTYGKVPKWVAAVAGGIVPTGETSANFGSHWTEPVAPAKYQVTDLRIDPQAAGGGAVAAGAEPGQYLVTMTISDGTTGNTHTYTGTITNDKTAAGKMNLTGTGAVADETIEIKRPSFQTLLEATKVTTPPATAGDPDVITYDKYAAAGTTSALGQTGTPAVNVVYDVTAAKESDALGLSGAKFILGGGTEGGPQDISTLTGISIGTDGVITATHPELGDIIVGRIDLVTFANPSGLKSNGGTYFVPSANSGEMNACKPGLDGSGQLISGSLELSNVDLSREFTDMITTQRGYQANSRIITVSDTMLEELVNLKR